MDKDSWSKLMYIKFMQGYVAGKGGKWEDRRTGTNKRGKKRHHNNSQIKSYLSKRQGRSKG